MPDDLPEFDDAGKDIYVDPRFQSYLPIEDKLWERRMLALTNNSPLSSSFFDLQVALAGCTSSFAMPWVTVAQMTGFVNGFTKTRQTFVEDYVARVTTSLTSRVHFTKNKRIQVEEAMHNMKINSQNELERYNAENPFNANAYWETIISKFPFRVAVWGLQRLCFTGIYYAYEDYLKHLCRVVSKDHGLWFGRADLAGELIASHLGEQVTLECWTDDRIDTCRLIRNALAHSGGIETTELAKKNHGLAILEVERDGMPTRREIQIIAF